MTTVFIPFEKMKAEFEQILLNLNFEWSKAERCAEIFATNSLEGVYSHGVNRFPRFVEYIQKNYINPGAEPELIFAAGALEQWNGNLGPGPLNAEICVERAMFLAQKNTIGCVAIANTNHWMRAGFYGHQAAKNGFAFIAWTNTIGNMPAWGATNCKLGNNPMVFALPFGKSAVVLDFAMSQFSYGKMETLKMEGKELPFAGGFNTKGELTNQPGEILESERPLPIGYWKGTGLSLLLDIFAAILSGGLATHEISKSKVEYGVSQVFIAIDLKKLKNYPSIENTISEIIKDLKNSVPENEHSEIRYPGERIANTREVNLKNGIPVNKKVWEEIIRLKQL